MVKHTDAHVNRQTDHETKQYKKELKATQNEIKALRASIENQNNSSVNVLVDLVGAMAPIVTTLIKKLDK